MTILKVYDTVVEAKNNAVNAYKDYISRGLDVKLYLKHPYKIQMNYNYYVYASNNPRYLLGMRFNAIEDYTKSGICDEIRACKIYPAMKKEG